MKKWGSFAFKTDIGKIRQTNEDQSIALSNLQGHIFLIVCDGMGGHNRGDIAAKLAAEYLSDSFKAKSGFFTSATARLWLTYHIKQANKLVYTEGIKNPSAKEMGTTLVTALIVDGEIIIGNIGDSRAYYIKNLGLQQLTEDQTYVDFLYRTGKITKDQMSTHPQKHVLLNALGLNPSVSFDLQVHAYHNDPLMLCSDGLYNNVSENELRTILLSSDTVNQKVDRLISIANANGGTDNIAIALWEPDRD